MRVNGTEVAAGQPATWPQNWSLLELSLKLTPLVVEPSNDAQLERLTLDLVVPLFGMMATLIGVEENELPTTGETEGRAVQSLTTRYERKKVNREACIQLKGSRCSVCGFDFAEHYGHLGIGYIEIHHIKSIASLGANYRINVATDLEPLCANCHAMAHREEPPVSIERLRLMVEEGGRPSQFNVPPCLSRSPMVNSFRLVTACMWCRRLLKKFTPLCSRGVMQFGVSPLAKQIFW